MGLQGTACGEHHGPADPGSQQAGEEVQGVSRSASGSLAFSGSPGKLKQRVQASLQTRACGLASPVLGTLLEQLRTRDQGGRNG